MLPETHPLIEAATKPLADNAEQRLAANAMLEENFDANDSTIPETLARLEAVRSKKRSVDSHLIPGIVATVFLAFSIFHVLPTYRLAKSSVGSTIFMPPDPPPLPSTLTREQRLLFPDPGLSDLQRLEQLTGTDPDDPAFYSEYVGAYSREHESLPPDYFETVARIAPDNSYFLYYAAARIGREAVENTPRKADPRPPDRFQDGVRLSPFPRDKDFSIKDSEAFSRALSLIEKAALLPDFETYVNRMTRLRAPLLPDKTLTDRIAFSSYAWGDVGSLIAMRKIADILAAQAQMAATEGQQEQFLKLVDIRKHFVTGISNNPDTMLVGELVNLVVVSMTAQYFQSAAETLGIHDLAGEFGRENLRIREMRDARSLRDARPGPDDFERRGSYLTALYLPLISNQVETPLRSSGPTSAPSGSSTTRLRPASDCWLPRSLSGWPASLCFSPATCHRPRSFAPPGSSPASCARPIGHGSFSAASCFPSSFTSPSTASVRSVAAITESSTSASLFPACNFSPS